MADINLSHALADFYRRRADTLACPPGAEAVLHHLTNVEDEAFAAMLAQRPQSLTALVEKFEAVLAHANGACGGEFDIQNAEQLLGDLRRLVAQ